MRVEIAILAFTSLFIGCKRAAVSLDGMPCDSSMACVTGYVCNPFTRLCVQPQAADCSSGKCPESGDPCEDPGTFIACDGIGTTCIRGCRMCQANYRYSDCRVSPCESLGKTAHCAACGDDCGVLILGADKPVCLPHGETFVCDYGGGCQPGYVDADGMRANGCECEQRCEGGCGSNDGCGGSCTEGCPISPPDDDDTCTPLMPQALCELARYECGPADFFDGCGQSISVDCGQCPTGSSCGNLYVGAPHACKRCSRRAITITAAGELVPAGYTVAVTFDHRALIASRESFADGRDVRVRWFDGTRQSWQELDRVLDPKSSWGREDTKLWFKLQADLSAQRSTSSYYLFYGDPTAADAPADEGQIFHFADFFERPDSTELGNDWEEVNDTILYDGCTSDVAIVDGGLELTKTCGLFYRPLVQRTFASIAGKIEFRLGMNFASGDANHGIAMQLGLRNSLVMPPTDAVKIAETASTGVLVHMFYGTLIGDNATYYRQLAWRQADLFHILSEEFSGLTHFRTKLDTSTKRYDLYIDDFFNPADCAFIPEADLDLLFPNPLCCPNQSFDNPIDCLADESLNLPSLPTFYAATEADSLDTVRFMAWNVDESYMPSRRIEYVIVRGELEDPPTVSLASPIDANCP